MKRSTRLPIFLGKQNSTLIALLMLVLPFGAGLHFHILYKVLNLPSPYILLFGSILLLVGNELLRQQKIEKVTVIYISVFCGLSAMVAAVYTFAGIAIYFPGYIQLIFFITLMLSIKSICCRFSHEKARAYLKAISFTFYAMAGYIILSWVVWHILKLNLNIVSFGVPNKINEYYGFRAIGFGKEASFAAFALAISYLPNIYLKFSNQKFSLLVYCFAAVALNSVTAMIFLLMFVFIFVYRTKSIIWFAVFSVLSILPVTYQYGDRALNLAQLRDSSIAMRIDTSLAGIKIIKDTFPIGVGYGNFQNHADYTHVHVLDALYSGTQLDNLKADSAIISLVAELGIFGLLIILIFLSTLLTTASYIPMMIGLTITIAAGGIIMPSLFVLVAQVGLLEVIQKKKKASKSPIS